MAEGAARLVHFEGRVVPATQATVGILSPALRGPIAYETLRGYWSEERGNLFLFRLRDHVARLTASMRILRFQQLFSFEDLSARILEVVRANRFSADIHLRILVYPLDQGGPGRTPTRSGVVIDAEPRPARSPRPAKCQVSSWLRRGGDNHPARVKAIGLRMFARAALAQAERDGYSDLIIQDDRGKVIEATSSNVFLVRRNVLVTPSVTDQILEGITRDTLLAISGKLNIASREREVDRTELYDCEEAFLCSTGLEVLPIASVDGLQVGYGAEGPITSTLRKEYLAVARGASGREEWLTPAY